MNPSPAAEPSHASTPRRFRLLGLDDFEVWRRGVTGLLIFTSALLVAYWAAWFADRGIVASNHTVEYVAFGQSFPLADAWLPGAALIAAIQCGVVARNATVASGSSTTSVSSRSNGSAGFT
jgi:hypothetical protein